MWNVRKWGVEDNLKVFGLSTVKSELNTVIVNWPLVFWYHCGFNQPQLGVSWLNPQVQKSTDTGGWLYCVILYEGLEHPWYETGSPGTSSSSIPRDDHWCLESCRKNRLRGENTKSSYVYFEYFSVEKVLLNIQVEMAYKQLKLRVYSLEKLELEMEVWEDTV